MIRAEDIATAATKEGVRPQEVEKEYLQFAFLHSLSDSPDGLVFRGGTMLRVAHGHPRYSEDLDFVRLHSTEEAETAVEDALSDLRNWGLRENHDEPERSAKGTLIWQVEFRGPLYHRERRVNRIKIDVGTTEDVAIPADRTIVLQKFVDIPSFVLFTQNRQETVAEKVRGLVQRDFARDLYDVAHLVRQGFTAPAEIVEKKLRWTPQKPPEQIEPHEEGEYYQDLELWVPATAKLSWQDAWRLAQPYLKTLRCVALPPTVP